MRRTGGLMKRLAKFFIKIRSMQRYDFPADFFMLRHERGSKSGNTNGDIQPPPRMGWRALKCRSSLK
jgi:hypothetical protein